MKHSKEKIYLDCGRGFLLLVFVLIWMLDVCESALGKSVRVAAIFDHGGDPRHELGFRAAIDNINSPDNPVLRVLPGNQKIHLEPVVLKVLSGERYEFYPPTFLPPLVNSL